MGLFKEILRRAGHFGRRSRFEGELDEEFRFHVETRVEELQRGGMPPAEAVAQARREFGSRARVSEETRSAWQFQPVEEIVANVRHALRAFAHRPAFAATAVACLAIGIGANTLIFSLVNAVLLRSLPYPDSDRLVVLWFTPPNDPNQKFGTNTGAFFELRDHSTLFESMGAGRLNQAFNAAPDDDSAGREWVQTQWFSLGLTQVLGTQPMIGRWPTEQEQGRMMISYSLWQRWFGGNPNVVGKSLRIDAGISRVSGVMPPGFELLVPNVDLWVLQTDANLRNALRSPNRIFTVVGRMKPGVTVEQVQAEMNTIAPRVSEIFPETHLGWGVKAELLQDAYIGAIRKPLWILQGAVFMLLLVACANVAGLLLAQASGRQKELAVRAALGSSRWRIVRQLLTENMLLSFFGGLVGVALAWIGLRAIVAMPALPLPHAGQIALDWKVLAFACVISLSTGLISGVIPALQVSRLRLIEAMRTASRSASASLASSRLRGAFVVAQVSLALVLLMGAGLLIRSMVRLNAVAPGLNPRGLVAVQMPFARSFYTSVPNAPNTPAGGFLVRFDARFSQLVERIRQRLAQVPGVQAVTSAVTPPLGGEPRRLRFSRNGKVIAQQEREVWSAEWYPISPEYFETLQIPLLRGRTVERGDTHDARPVVVINAALARRFFDGENPLGQLIQLDLLDEQPREVVGVVGDVRQNRYQTEPQPQFYVPRDQLAYRMDMTVSLEVLVTNFIVRTSGDTAGIMPALRAAITEVDNNQPIARIRTVEEYAAGQLRDLNQYALLLSLFGAISVALALTGLFGVMAQAVSQRTNEIGIRLALGAPPSKVLTLVLGQGVRLIVAGLLLGVAASALLMPVIRSFLWGVTPTDPITFVLVAAALAAVAICACYLPARRALKVDPVIALRSE